MERFEVFRGYGKDALLLTCSLTMSVWVACLATVNKAKASCFARLSKEIGISTRNTYPFATIKARSCVGYLDAGRRSLLCFIFGDRSSSYFLINIHWKLTTFVHSELNIKWFRIMKKIIYPLLTLTFLINVGCSQVKEQSKTPEEKHLSLSSNYELFETRNIWVFIKLNTRNGKMSQVHFSLDSESYRGEQPLNEKPLVDKAEEKIGRFTLYPTQNMFNFILLDKISGRSYQVQWSLKEDERVVVPI